MGRLRQRLDRMENQASNTMSQASHVLRDLVGLIEDVHDDVRIRMVKDKPGSLMDFVLGKINECPVSFRLEIREDDDKTTV